MSIREREETQMLTYNDVWPLKSTIEPSLSVPFSSTVPNRSRRSEIRY